MKSWLWWMLLCSFALGAPAYSPANPTLNGVWDQFYGDFFACRIRLQSGRQGYLAQTLKVSPLATPAVIRTYDHQLQGSRWVFKSDWQEQGIAEFRLDRKGPDRFEGYCYLKGARFTERTTFVRQR